MKQKIKIACLSVIATLLFAEEKSHFTLKADKITYFDKEKKTIAAGHAQVDYKKNALSDPLAKKANDKTTIEETKISTTYQLKADKITAFHNDGLKNKTTDQPDYRQIDADGSITFENEQYTLAADHCTLDNPTEKITCKGRATILDKTKGNTVKGSTIIFDLKNEYYQAFGDNCEKAEISIFDNKNVSA